MSKTVADIIDEMIDYLNVTITDCIVCGQNITKDWHCTNRCCRDCHRQFCTDGGNNYPGHYINITQARAAYWTKPA